MKTKQIFRNLLLGGLLVTAFVGLQSVKNLQAKASIHCSSKKGFDWRQGQCPAGSTGITCYYTSVGAYCPQNWQNNPNYQCTWY